MCPAEWGKPDRYRITLSDWRSTGKLDLEGAGCRKDKRGPGEYTKGEARNECEDVESCEVKRNLFLKEMLQLRWRSFPESSLHLVNMRNL